MPSCVAYGCSNRVSGKTKRQKLEEEKQKVTFHKFPKRPEKRRQMWIEAVRRENWTPSPRSVICSMHFEEKYFDRTSLVYVRLRENAVPTIFKGLPSCMQKLEEDMENYIKFKLTGCQKRMKKDVVPHVFDCQPDRKRTHTKPERAVAVKRRKLQTTHEVLTLATASSSTEMVIKTKEMELEYKQKMKDQYEKQKLLNKERQRRWRERQKKEKLKEIRLYGAIRQKSRETEEERNARRAANTASHARRLARETPEQAKARKASNSLSQSRRLARETPEQAEARRASNARAQLRRRAGKTLEQTKINEGGENYHENKIMGKSPKSDDISQKFCDYEQSTTTKHNNLRLTQENLDINLDESKNNIKEELQSDEIEIKYNPIEFHEELKYTIEEAKILPNIKTEPCILDSYNVCDKNIKIEFNDTEVQSENVLEPIKTVFLLNTIKSETTVDEDEDPLKI